MKNDGVSFHDYEIIVAKVKETLNLNTVDARGWLSRNTGLHCLTYPGPTHCGIVLFDHQNNLIMERIQKILGPYGNTFIRMIHVTQEDCE